MVTNQKMVSSDLPDSSKLHGWRGHHGAIEEPPQVCLLTLLLGATMTGIRLRGMSEAKLGRKDSLLRYANITIYNPPPPLTWRKAEATEGCTQRWTAVLKRKVNEINKAVLRVRWSRKNVNRVSSRLWWTDLWRGIMLSTKHCARIPSEILGKFEREILLFFRQTMLEVLSSALAICVTACCDLWSQPASLQPKEYW